jgi:itaconyl-CoA hydratase / mesaconyl-C4 CoA hydratase
VAGIGQDERVTLTAEDLAAALDGWAPEPVALAEPLDPVPAARLHAALDLPGDPPGDGDELPPWWQWLYFLDWRPGEGLGEDGHPASGHFFPPVPARRRMIAGGRATRHAPLRLGRPAQRRSRLERPRVVSARTGPLALMTLRHELVQDGVTCLVEEQDLAYRSGDGGVRPTRPVPLPDDVPAAERFGAGAVLLFRFSALTGNAHRIHYDEPYATGVERYPGLVVHGPLLAVLLARALVGAAGGRPPAELGFRLSAPVFAGDTVRLTTLRAEAGQDGADVVESLISDGVGAALATSRATFA